MAELIAQGLAKPFGSQAALRSETRDAVAAALATAGQTAHLVTHDQPEALQIQAFQGSVC